MVGCWFPVLKVYFEKVMRRVLEHLEVVKPWDMDGASTVFAIMSLLVE